MIKIVSILVSVFCLGSLRATEIEVTTKAGLHPANNSGRLVLRIKPDGDGNDSQKSKLGERTELVGVDVPDIASTLKLRIDNNADAYPLKLDDLPAGKYTIESGIDVQHLDSNWRREPGNLFGPITHVEVGKGEAIQLTITSMTAGDPPPKVEGVEWFTMDSKLLSDFRGTKVQMRAGILLPANYDPKKHYAAVYEIPGFGGNHMYAAMAIAKRKHDPHLSQRPDNVFWIILDPEGPNGHTLFMDSDNNGPCGKALIEELIPALEAKYPLVAKPEARIARGHSSGGWASLWLAITYPDVFGACFSTSPDPVDFRKFETIDIYHDENLYTDSDNHERPASRNGKITVRDENGSEEVVGPNNTSADQWDSWQACWGHRAADGRVSSLFDSKTGKINHEEAESYRRFDITDLLRTNPQKYLPLFRDHVRILVGDQDTFFLNEAVSLLQQELNQHIEMNGIHQGYIKFAAGKDHGTVMQSVEMKGMVAEMRAIGEAVLKSESQVKSE